MSFSAVGTVLKPTLTGKTFPLAPAGSSDFILFGIICSGTTADWATALSSTNVTWSALGTHLASAAGNNVTVALFLGQVTSTSSATVTITTNAGSPTIRIAGQEFSSTAGFSAVTLDVSGTTDVASGGAMPSASPTRAGDLYWGYTWDTGTGVGGSTSGYVYQLDANSNITAYNLSCAHATQSPNIGDTNGTTGIAVMLYESGAVSPTAGIAAGTGTAQKPSVSFTAGVAAATGTAVAPLLSARLAAGTGAALAPAITFGGITTRPPAAAGTGAALAPQPFALSAAVAAATGTAVPPSMFVTGLAAATGTVPASFINAFMRSAAGAGQAYGRTSTLAGLLALTSTGNGMTTVTAVARTAAATAAAPVPAATWTNITTAGLAAAVASGQQPAVATVVTLVDTAVTASQVAAATGVANSTVSFSPPSGSLVLVEVVWLFDVNATATVSCQDSLSNAYTAGPQIQDNSGAVVTALFTHFYASAPGAVTVRVTATNTGAADALIVPHVLTGQALSQAGAATVVVNSGAVSTAAVQQSVTTTKVGSYVFLVAGAGGAVAFSAISGTTTSSAWNDASSGDSAAAGRTLDISGAPGPVTVGWTAAPATTYGFAALEVLAAVTTAATAAATGSTPAPSAAVTAAAGLAAGTGSVPLPATGAVAPTAAGAGTAWQPAVGTTGPHSAFAGPAAATGTAQAPVPGPAGTAGAAATGTGQPAASPVAFFTATAAATGTVPLPSITLTGNKAVFPPAAAGTGTARQLAPSAAVTTGAAGTGAAWWVFNIAAPLLTMSGFGTFSQVPAGTVILAVIANITQYSSDTTIAAPVYELWDGASARIGVPQQGAVSTATSHTDSLVFTGVSYSQLATLQLRMYAGSQQLNSGATVSVDAASLSVEWSATVVNTFPGVRAAITKFPPPKVSGAVNASITPAVLSGTTTWPPATAGVINAAVLPGRQRSVTSVPRPVVSCSTTVSPAVLAVIPVITLVSSITVPGWASAETDGSWTNPGNVFGPPDGSVAVWTVP